MTSSNLLKDSVKYRPGIFFGGGFVYTVSLSERFNVGLEALYTGKAFNRESPIIKYRYFYLDIPLYLQYKLGENIRFNLGGQYSGATNSKIIQLNSVSKSGVNVQTYSNIKGGDPAFLAGLEVDLAENLSLMARYTVSTSTFFNKGSVNFGVFMFGFNYAVYRSHRQFLHKDKTKE